LRVIPDLLGGAQNDLDNGIESGFALASGPEFLEMGRRGISPR